jgi:uncharacterized protein with GYD domain
MATFLMFGKYSQEAVKGISAARTKKAVGVINKLGGDVKAVYALLGEYDLVFIVELPSIQDVMKASLNLSKATGISFATAPAIRVEEFDKLAAAQ